MQTKIIFLIFIILFPLIFISCSQKDEMILLKKDIQQLKSELDSIKIQKEKWQDYDVKGKWVLTDTMQAEYKMSNPKYLYILKFEFFDKPYMTYSDYSMEVGTRYEVDYNKIIVYAYKGLVPLGQKPIERVFLTFHLKSKDTLICKTDAYWGVYIKKE